MSYSVDSASSSRSPRPERRNPIDDRRTYTDDTRGRDQHRRSYTDETGNRRRPNFPMPNSHSVESSRSSSHSRDSSSNSSREISPVRDVDFDTTLHNQPGLNIALKRKNSVHHSSGDVKPTHTMFWEGKKIILTHTRNEDTPQRVGHNSEEWHEIAAAIKEMLDKKKETAQDFTFTAARFNNTTGTFEWHKNELDPKTSEDWAQHTTLGPLAQKAKGVFLRCHGTPIKSIKKDAPKDPLEDQRRQQPGNPPPPDPVDQPALPQDDRSWFKKKWDGFLSLFKRSENS